ncbi:UNVERIFIED_CONTAM: hypothetical protein PYX00_006533 [Menopon gallinae]|uniref:CHHC U11-48K-type domain-containing protein n=1 Tax=Menopon gallinae TaxID=328185 RepID=A0AAW2HVI0_9NEOP
MLYNDVQCDFVCCPFEKSHVIRRHRLPYHLQKCKKNHPDVKLDACSYNFSHLISKTDLVEHLESCPSKCWIESGRYNKVDDGVCEKKIQESGLLVGETEEEEARSSFFVGENFSSRKLNSEVINRGENETGSSSENTISGSERFHDERLTPLPLPKTTSKAFRLKK